MIDEIELPELRDPILSDLKEKYEAHYDREYSSGDKKGLYRDHDWRRLQFAARLIPEDANSVLDVGVGPGPLLNYLTISNQYSHVVGIDIRRYSRFVQFAKNLNFEMMSVADMHFSDSQFDVVICMEVLEHVDTNVMLGGISELRRVAKKKLIMTVPYEEPLPLPSYHKQRFNMERIKELFPDAKVTLLYRPGKKTWPWALLEETW